GIRYLNKELEEIHHEVGATENISPGGARVYVRSPPPDFEFVRITNLPRTFESLARVCNRYVGGDSFEHLCLQFLDKQWTTVP
ncbi:MAG TPA: hypothetical protein VJX67_16880, partial [Blastocatellia bacterium]|nr:hypothetical protein [Blastocatellia bacterium]